MTEKKETIYCCAQSCGKPIETFFMRYDPDFKKVYHKEECWKEKRGVKTTGNGLKDSPRPYKTRIGVLRLLRKGMLTQPEQLEDKVTSEESKIDQSRSESTHTEGTGSYTSVQPS